MSKKSLNESNSEVLISLPLQIPGAIIATQGTQDLMLERDRYIYIFVIE